MDARNFESSTFGSCKVDDNEGFTWFDPAPLPRSLSLDDETILVLAEAEAALGRLSGAGGRLREPELLVRPYAVREALASARIEGTQARMTDVFQAEASGAQVSSRFGDLRALSAHLRATEQGVQLVTDGKIDLEMLLRLHATLMLGTRRGGHFRRQPVWIGSPTAEPTTAVFVPPIGDAMDGALKDLDHFLVHPPRISPLIRCALAHYQFLTIHPMLDGNGRIGRLLVLLFLLQEKRLPAALLYLSAYFERHRTEYFDRLQAVRERGKIQEWLQFFLTAIKVQAADGMARADTLLDLREHYRAELAASRSRAWQVVELLFENPVTTTGIVKERVGVTTQGALNLLRQLEARGWLHQLRQRGIGGSTYWLATEVYEQLGGDSYDYAEEQYEPQDT